MSTRITEYGFAVEQESNALPRTEKRRICVCDFADSAKRCSAVATVIMREQPPARSNPGHQIVPAAARDWLRALVFAKGESDVAKAIGLSLEAQTRVLAGLPIRASNARILELVHEQAIRGTLPPGIAEALALPSQPPPGEAA